MKSWRSVLAIFVLVTAANVANAEMVVAASVRICRSEYPNMFCGTLNKPYAGKNLDVILSCSASVDEIARSMCTVHYSLIKVQLPYRVVPITEFPKGTCGTTTFDVICYEN